MSIIFILFNFCKSEVFHFDEELYEKIINMKERPPIFIELWDPWCSYCTFFKNDWDRMTNHEAFKDRIVFGDINCQKQKKLCDKINPGSEFPRFVWIDEDNNKTRCYTGSYAINELAPWLDSQIKGPLEVVNDSEKFEMVRMQTMLRMPLFRFIVNSNDEKNINIIKDGAKEVKHYQIRLIISYQNESCPPQLIHHTFDNRVITMNESLSVDNIIKFVKIHALRFFAPYSDMVAQFSHAEQIPIMIFAFPNTDSHSRKIAFETARSVQNMLPTSQLNCQYDGKFCRYYGISDINGTVVIINKYLNFFWIHKLDEQVYEWAADVLNGKIKGYGPGNSPLKDIMLMFYEYRSIGGYKYYLFFLPFVLFVLVVILLIILIATTPPKAKKD